jgi:hypothetical protein
MPQKNTYHKNQLELELEEGKDSANVIFRGKSADRDPSEFIMPILLESIDICLKKGFRLIIDLQNLEFMNSSTITPITKIIELGKTKKIPITLIYRKSIKWQELNFSALRIFESKESKIEITGK